MDLFGKEAADYINQFFCTIGDKLVRVLPNSYQSMTTPQEFVRYNYILGSGLSEKQVKDEIMKIDVNKSSGFVEINARCLKMCLLKCIPEFNFILNS